VSHGTGSKEARVYAWLLQLSWGSRGVGIEVGCIWHVADAGRCTALQNKVHWRCGGVKYEVKK
jgi:hypothetical protein